MAEDNKGNASNTNIQDPLNQLTSVIQAKCIDPCENPPKDSEISLYGLLGQGAGVIAYGLLVVQAAFFTYSAWLQYIQFRCNEKNEAESQSTTAKQPSRTVTVKEKRTPKGISGGSQANDGASPKT